MTPSGILLIIVVVVLLYLILSFQGFASENDVLKDRLASIIEEDDVKPIEPKKAPEMAKVDKGKRNEKVYGVLANLGKMLTPGNMSQKISKKLEYANIPLKANEFAAMNLLSTVIPGSLVMMLFKSYLYGGIAAAIGWWMPNFILSSKIKKRQKQFQTQLLDNLVMLSNSMKAGYSFLQGLDLISKESPPPSGEEFKRIVRENALGMDVEKSLNDLNERMSSEDFDLVVTVIMIQRQIGGNLSEILDGISNTIRERIRIKGQIATLTAQARLSGYVVALLPVGIFVAFSMIRWDIMKVFFTYEDGGFKAYYMLVLAIFMQVVGFSIIQKITNIEV